MDPDTRPLIMSVIHKYTGFFLFHDNILLDLNRQCIVT